MGQQKGGKKLRRSPKHASYYTHVQPIRTARNRTQRAIKRARRKAYWQEQGVKKNGEPVSTKESVQALTRAVTGQSDLPA